MVYPIKNKIKQFHAISRTQRGKQREPSVKTLRSPLSVEFRRHCVLSGGTQRRLLPRYESKEIKYLILYFLEWESNTKTVASTMKSIDKRVILFVITVLYLFIISGT